MNLLRKVIDLREKAHPDHEKPFLEHLEDLRIMITRMVITLLISMIICFTFQKQLMEVLRRPVEQVWVTQLEARLPRKTADAPKPLDVDQWEKAKQIEHAASSLTPSEREAFFRSLNDSDLAFHARAAGLLRAALALPEDVRGKFVSSLDAPEDLKKQVTALLKTSPSPEIDNRGNLKLMSALKPTETFMLSMKLSFFAGIILSFPLLLMYLLQFVLPGLHTHERKVMWPAMAVGFGLFLGGVLFSYYIVLPRALGFFYEWSGSLGVSNDWRIGEYISFATQFTLLFGLSFETPVIVMVLVKLGLLTYETMSRTRSYAIVAIFVAAAILTPTPDVFTLTLMAAPMIVLYEICIWLAWLDRRKNRLAEEEEARERAERDALWEARRAEHEAGEVEPAEAEETEEAGDDGWKPEHEPRYDYPDVSPETESNPYPDDDSGQPPKP